MCFAAKALIPACFYVVGSDAGQVRLKAEAQSRLLHVSPPEVLRWSMKTKAVMEIAMQIVAEKSKSCQYGALMSGSFTCTRSIIVKKRKLVVLSGRGYLPVERAWRLFTEGPLCCWWKCHKSVGNLPLVLGGWKTH